ncbi:MAG: sulfotransferase domain-containing protein [Casimicrobiaceae bacterium]
MHSGTVDFVVAGTQKGGTSTLDAYLREHPEVCMPSADKEVHYFDDDAKFAAAAAAADYVAYHAHFTPAPQQRLLGDATPVYMFHPPAPARIHAYNPSMKFIMLLRDPAKRAYSHWNMEVKLGREDLSFDDAIRAEAEGSRVSTPTQARQRAYVQRGFYSAQLQRIWGLFPASQTLVLRSDQFAADSASVLAQVAAFLGVAAFPRADRRKVFKLPYAASMTDRALAQLRGTFAAEVDTLERVLGWDLSHWKGAA